MKTAHSEKGSSIVPIVIGVVVILLIGFYISIQPGGFLSKKVIESIPSQNSTIPTEQWLTYDNTNPKFSVQYPSDWGYQIRAGDTSGNLIAVQFMPKGGGAEVASNNVTLRVLDKKEALTLQDWVSKYTTSFAQGDPAIQGKNFFIFKMQDISNAKIAGKDVINFSTDFATVGKADGTIIASDKYVFIFLGLKGKAVETRNKIIESLSF